MKLSFELPPYIRTYTNRLKGLSKHHYFIVTVILCGGVAMAVFMVDQTLNIGTDDAYAQERRKATIGSKFNKRTEETIEKIKALQRSTDTGGTAKPLPTNQRINPFAE